MAKNKAKKDAESNTDFDPESFIAFMQRTARKVFRPVRGTLSRLRISDDQVLAGIAVSRAHQHHPALLNALARHGGIQLTGEAWQTLWDLVAGKLKRKPGRPKLRSIREKWAARVLLMEELTAKGWTDVEAACSETARELGVKARTIYRNRAAAKADPVVRSIIATKRLQRELSQTDLSWGIKPRQLQEQVLCDFENALRNLNVGTESSDFQRNTLAGRTNLTVKTPSPDAG